MSQASRSHALAPVRWRKQVARFIAEHARTYERDVGGPLVKGHQAVVAGLLDGGVTFDVHAVRADGWGIR